MAGDPTQTTTPETNEKAVAAVKRWMVKRGYSAGGSDNIEFLLANLEGQMWDRVRLESANRPSSDIEDGFIRFNPSEG